MQANDYQQEARGFAVYPDLGDNIVYPALGLAGEAGEFANQVKKVLRDDYGNISPDRHDKMVDELGDVLWYVANEAAELGVDLEYVMQVNILKLARRRDNDRIHGDNRNDSYLIENDLDSYDPMGG